MSDKYKIKVNEFYIKEEEYRYLVKCSEEDASLFTEKEADDIIEFLEEESEKIKINQKRRKTWKNF